MAQVYWLDTNAYFLLYQPHSVTVAQGLTLRLTSGGVLQCSVSEITSLEIHSVLGKYSRAEPAAPYPCDRMVVGPSGPEACKHRWIPRSRTKIHPRKLRNLHKLISDAEQQRGTLQVRVHPVPAGAYQRARQYLQKHAITIPVGSHDALIAASVALAQTADSANTIQLVTSDRGLKRLLQAEGIPHYDPLTNQEWSPSPPVPSMGGLANSI